MRRMLAEQDLILKRTQAWENITITREACYCYCKLCVVISSSQTSFSCYHSYLTTMQHKDIVKLTQANTGTANYQRLVFFMQMTTNNFKQSSSNILL